MIDRKAEVTHDLESMDVSESVLEKINDLNKALIQMSGFKLPEITYELGKYNDPIDFIMGNVNSFYRLHKTIEDTEPFEQNSSFGKRTTIKTLLSGIKIIKPTEESIDLIIQNYEENKIFWEERISLLANKGIYDGEWRSEENRDFYHNRGINPYIHDPKLKIPRFPRLRTTRF